MLQVHYDSGVSLVVSLSAGAAHRAHPPGPSPSQHTHQSIVHSCSRHNAHAHYRHLLPVGPDLSS